ncbi:MAG: hypothetical protein ACM3NH_00535 [Candidatus Saccharibacteria bacterium]
MFRKKMINIGVGLISAFAMVPVTYGAYAPQPYSYTTAAPQPTAGGYAYYSTATPDFNQIAGYYNSFQPAMALTPQPQMIAQPGINYAYSQPASMAYPMAYPANYPYSQAPAYSSMAGGYSQPQYVPVQTPAYQPPAYTAPPRQSYPNSFIGRCQRIFSDVRHVTVTFFNRY